MHRSMQSSLAKVTSSRLDEFDLARIHRGYIIFQAPDQMRYWLPDRKHQYQGLIRGDKYLWAAIKDDGLSVLSGSIALDNPDWHRLAQMAQKFAERKYGGRRV